METSGRLAMKALIVMCFLRKGEARVDWIRTVAVWSSIVTIVLVGLYLLQQGY
jgi:hypothetical protein